MRTSNLIRRCSTRTAILALLIGGVVVVGLPGAAYADSQTGSNNTAMNVPAGGNGAPDYSPSSLYPSPITISGMSGSVTKVTVTLTGLSHNVARDPDVLLVGPGGQKVMVMSDMGTNNPISNLTLTFDDDAASAPPGGVSGNPDYIAGQVTSGTYKPKNYAVGFTNDDFAAPAPGPPYADTLAAFNGTNPNGTWNLFVSDDSNGDSGTLAGWSLTVETGVATFPGQLQFSDVEYRGTEGGGVATVTIDRVNGDDGSVGVTFATGSGSATPGSDYTPVSQTVTFADGVTHQTVYVPISDDSAAEGIDELVPITLTNATGGATLGSRTTSQIRVQDNDARSNAFPIDAPAVGSQNGIGSAYPYPSNIVVAGAGGVVTDVDVTLTDITHAQVRDFDILLVAPNGATTWLMQDAGPQGSVSGLNLTFSDEAASAISRTDPLASGTYQPTQYDDEVADPMASPAPAGPYGTTLAALDGSSPNGTWSLFVTDGQGGDIGDIGGGWSLSLTTATASAGGPYTAPEGTPVSLSGSTTPDVPGATYEWDVDGDGQYDDATGKTPTVSAATLSSIGLGDGPDSSNVRVRATSGSAVITSNATTLTITNQAPTATFTNDGPVTLGHTADVTFSGQSDASSADSTAGFRYAYDFDDDGDWEVGDGTYAGGTTSASATVPTTVLDAVGTYEVNGRILDKDGGFTDYTTTITVDPPPNADPVADAGADQVVNPGSAVTLDGTNSDDTDGDLLSYAWVQTAGPAVTLSGADTDSPAFTAPSAGSVLTFELTVDDGQGGSDSDTVTITVNRPPSADAGPDRTVQEGDPESLDASGSSDPDGDALSYSWTQTGGTSVTLSGADTATPTFTAPTGPATLTFEVTVTDAWGLTDTDTVSLTVNAAPVADAGEDQVVDSGAVVGLDGSGSTDAEGETLTYGWVQTAGPAVILLGATSSQAQFTAPTGPSTLTFRLRVDDPSGGSSSDTVTIRVNGDPSADAGPDQDVLAGDPVTLDASGSSDPDGDDLDYAWSQTAGATVVLSDATSATPTFLAPASGGTLTFKVTVSDPRGRSDDDTVDVVVDRAPSADAGPDQDVAGGAAVTLDGTGSSDPDGDSLTYSWVQTSGPAVTLSDDAVAQPSFTAPAGDATLRFSLTVEDGRSGTDTDSVEVRVDATAPTVVLSSGAPDPTNGAIPVTVQFSEAVTGLALGDFVATNGTATGLSGSGSTYQVTLAPGVDGATSLTLPANAAADQADNPSQASNTLTRHYDGTRPTVILDGPPDPIQGAFSVSLTFSEPVTGLTAGEVAVTNGSAGNLTGSGSTYSVTVTPTGDGEVTVMLPEWSAVDAAGNGNSASSALVRHYDGSAPELTVTAASGQPDPVRGDTVRFTVEASEAVSDLAASSITVAGTSGASGVAVTRVDADTFEIAVTGMTTSGTVSVEIAAGAVSDAAGNESAAASSPAIRWAATSAPELSAVFAQSCQPKGGTIALRLDPDDDAEVVVDSDNPRLLPGARITLDRADDLLRLSLRPRAGRSGVARVTVTATNLAGTDTFVLRVVVGGSGADRLRGSRLTDVILGRGGADVISGRAGTDLLCGGNGADRIRGGTGTDSLYGGRGDDVLKGGPGRDKLRGGPGRDRIVQD